MYNEERKYRDHVLHMSTSSIAMFSLSVDFYTLANDACY